MQQINVIYHVYGPSLQQGKFEDIPKEKLEQVQKHLSHLKETESEVVHALNMTLKKLGIPTTTEVKESKIDITRALESHG